MNNVSVVIPAKNEAEGLATVLPKLTSISDCWQLIVVDDGSTDNTRDVCLEHGVQVVSHSYSKGNGAAVKAGARKATGDIIVFMDGDGQHDPNDIPKLLNILHSQNQDMVVGARDSESQANVGRDVGNRLYNQLATYMTGHKVWDLTSGFRVVRANKFKEFLYLLPNGFSYPTTSTMAFFRAGYSVAYMPIKAAKRKGKSHLRLHKDGVRFLIIIFKIGTLYSPLKIFLPLSVSIFVTGFSYYMYTFSTAGRFTNMSALLFTTSLMIFLMGLISEQITTLVYKKNG
ncbi:glycosyltransferase family 2 protein [Halioxenophilus aromaticivorans]|uniref:Glycosyltransferase family 2 protein n=1 Tax=Halioxenophilus aromaticivorans TaxID=1306992 RepID=A0AAV3TY90_9ALTE